MRVKENHIYKHTYDYTKTCIFVYEFKKFAHKSLHNKMELLKKRILYDGHCLPGGILKVDSFINHQMDPVLMKSIGVEFIRRFANTSVNKIITI